MPLQKNVFVGKQRQILLFATPAKAIWVGWPKLKKITTGVTVIIIIIIITREFDLEYRL